MNELIEKIAFFVLPFCIIIMFTSVSCLVSLLLGLGLPWTFMGTMPSAIFAMWFISHERMRVDAAVHKTSEVVIYGLSQFSSQRIFVCIPTPNSFPEKLYHSNVAVVTLALRVWFMMRELKMDYCSGYYIVSFKKLSTQIHLVKEEKYEPWQYNGLMDEAEKIWKERR